MRRPVIELTSLVVGYMITIQRNGRSLWLAFTLMWGHYCKPFDPIFDRGQELQGPDARRIPWDRRQGTVGEGVCKEPESHRSTGLRDQRRGKGLDEVGA